MQRVSFPGLLGMTPAESTVGHPFQSQRPDPDPALWYVVFTKPRQESFAVEHLGRQDFETYLPLFKLVRRGRPEPVFEPMFPRYVFLRQKRHTQSLEPIRSTRGVCGLVRFGGHPATVSDGLIRSVVEIETKRNAASVTELMAWRKGQTVIVADGPMKGLEGVIVEVARQRVTVLLELLGRPTPVLVGHQTLQAA